MNNLLNCISCAGYLVLLNDKSCTDIYSKGFFGCFLTWKIQVAGMDKG